MKTHRAIAVYMVALILAVGCVPACFAVDAVDATEAINQAELSLNSAFVAVAEAQVAGADVGRLLDNLDAAGDFLSEADIALRSGDYVAASLLAAESKHAIEGLVTEASRLKAGAERTKTDTMILTAFWSSVGLILLLVLGMAGWRILKKRYFEQVLEMKPKVEENR